MKLLVLLDQWNGLFKTYFKRFKKLNINFELCVTNMHLLKSNGYTIQEIENDNFEVTIKFEYLVLKIIW